MKWQDILCTITWNPNLNPNPILNPNPNYKGKHQNQPLILWEPSADWSEGMSSNLLNQSLGMSEKNPVQVWDATFSSSKPYGDLLNKSTFNDVNQSEITYITNLHMRSFFLTLFLIGSLNDRIFLLTNHQVVLLRNSYD